MDCMQFYTVSQPSLVILLGTAKTLSLPRLFKWQIAVVLFTLLLLLPMRMKARMALTVASTWSSRRKTHLGSGLNHSSVDLGLELEQVRPLHIDDETCLSKTQPAILKT